MAFTQGPFWYRSAFSQSSFYTEQRVHRDPFTQQFFTSVLTLHPHSVWKGCISWWFASAPLPALKKINLGERDRGGGREGGREGEREREREREGICKMCRCTMWRFKTLGFEYIVKMYIFHLTFKNKNPSLRRSLGRITKTVPMKLNAKFWCVSGCNPS